MKFDQIIFKPLLALPLVGLLAVSVPANAQHKPQKQKRGQSAMSLLSNATLTNGTIVISSSSNSDIYEKMMLNLHTLDGVELQ